MSGNLPGSPARPSPAVPSAFGLFAIATVFVASALLAWVAWGYYFGTPWTRDGTVRVYTAQVASEVSGRVTAVLVRDNQAVRKGDVLFRIDDRDYQNAMRRTAAAMMQAKAQAANIRTESERRNKEGDMAVSEEARQTFQSNADAAEAAYNGTVALFDEARINVERTEVRSPVNGFVSNLLLQTGTYAVAGQPVMTLVDSDSFWVSGYFEETQIRRIRAGDPARIILIGYPDKPITGHVDSLSRGIMDPNAAPGVAGLQNVNPVFTWVRLAQRIPVRITIEQLPAEVHLAAGMTATVHVRP